MKSSMILGLGFFAASLLFQVSAIAGTIDGPLLAFGGGYVGGIALSPDGKRCAIGRGKYLLITDTETGKCLRVLSGHEGSIAGAVFSADAKRIATSSYDRRFNVKRTSYSRNHKLDFSVRVWDASDGHCEKVLEGHTDSVVGLAISSDGSTIVSGSDDATARIWNVQSGACELTLAGHEKGIGSVAISPDGKTVATGSGDFTARLWDLQSGALLKLLKGHEAPVYSVAFSPDGTQLVTGSPDRTARLWDIQTGNEIRKLNCGASAFRKIGAGARAMMGSDFFGPPPAGDMVLSTCFSGDGLTLLTGISSGEIIEWDAVKGKRIRTIKSATADLFPHSSKSKTCRTFTSTRDNSTFMNGSLDGVVRLWDSHSGRLLQSFGGNGDSEILSMALSPNGNTLATGSYNGAVFLWDVHDGHLQKTLEFYDINRYGVGGIAFTHNGTRLFTSNHDDRFRIWRLEDGKKLDEFREWERIFGLSGTPDGKWAALWDVKKSVHVLDLESGKRGQSFSTDKRGFDTLNAAISPDHQWVAASFSATAGGRIELWNAQSGQLMFTKGPGLASDQICFAGDGATFITGWNQTTARVWRTRDGECVAELQYDDTVPSAHDISRVITSLALSSNGRIALGGVIDGRIVAWRVNNGKRLRIFPGHLDTVKHLVFAPDDSTFVSTGEDKIALLWKTPDEHMPDLE